VASRDEASAKRVPRHSCEAATAGWFELSSSLSFTPAGTRFSPSDLIGAERTLDIAVVALVAKAISESH
jgi:hypothetical protein